MNNKIYSIYYKDNSILIKKIITSLSYLGWNITNNLNDVPVFILKGNRDITISEKELIKKYEIPIINIKDKNIKFKLYNLIRKVI